MVSARVLFHPEAVEDLRGALAWYSERSAELATAFGVAFSDAVEMLRQAPEAWPRYDEKTRRYLMRRFPYSVIYRIAGATLEVVAVAHAKRRPGFWKAR